MADIYDNWERLVNAVVRREKDKQLALIDSSETSSIGSPSSATSHSGDISSSSRFDDDQYSFVQRERGEVPMDYSDLVLSHNEWKAMLPPNQHELVFKSASLGFFLDKRTRKSCFILGASRLQIFQDQRKPHPKSRFLEVVELVDTTSFRIRGEIYAKMLSPGTTYAAYVVFGFVESYKILESANWKITIVTDVDPGFRCPSGVVHFQSGSHRADGWMEVNIGSFPVPRRQKYTKIQVGLDNWWGDKVRGGHLIVEGIEFRPFSGKGIFSKLRISSKA